MNRKIVAALTLIMLSVASPIAHAAPTIQIQGGPYSGLKYDGNDIYLAIKGIPAAKGIYIFEAVYDATGARPTEINPTAQINVIDGGKTDSKGTFAASDPAIHIKVVGTWTDPKTKKVTDCLVVTCALFAQFDYPTGSYSDLSQDQYFAPKLSFTAGSMPSAPKPAASTFTVFADGAQLSQTSPGTLYYEKEVKLKTTSSKGSARYALSPDPSGVAACALTGHRLKALKGSTACNLEVTVGTKTGYFPFFLKPSMQAVNNTNQTLAVGQRLILRRVTNVGEAITFANSTPNICTLTNASVKAISVGDCVITEVAPASKNYLALDQKLTISVK